MRCVAAYLAFIGLSGAAAPDLRRAPSSVRVSTAGAERSMHAAVALAQKRGLHRCIAIADAYGQLDAFEKMDGAITGCVDTSIAKSRSLAQSGVPTTTFFERAAKENLPLGFVPGIVPAAGGSPLRRSGVVFGAIGVSGSDVETEAALAADASAVDK